MVCVTQIRVASICSLTSLKRSLKLVGQPWIDMVEALRGATGNEFVLDNADFLLQDSKGGACMAKMHCDVDGVRYMDINAPRDMIWVRPFGSRNIVLVTTTD